MNWEPIRLAELIEIKHGFAFDGAFFSDSGRLILLTPGSCYPEGGLKLRGEKERYYVGEYLEEYLLREGDLLVVMTDLVNTAPILGGAFIIPENDRFLHNQRLGLVQITDPARIDKKFLFYLLNTYSYRAQVRGSASGATVRHTSPSRIKECVVKIPRDVEYQGRVAAALSAYDHLIENNRRRIMLLEKASRLLYREWFVRLRFPGHEHTRVVEGTPDGWQMTTLGEVLTLKRGYDLPESKRLKGEVPIVSSSGITGYHKEDRVKAPGVVTGRYGALGEVFFVQKNFWPLNTALYVSDFKYLSPEYAAHLLRTLLAGVQSDKAAVPGLNRNVLHQMGVLIPPKPLRDQFSSFATLAYRQIYTLENLCEKLRSARDLLLPRLMSGEVEV